MGIVTIHGPFTPESLETLLKLGTVHCSFIKTTGERRTMRATLSPHLFEDHTHGTVEKEVSQRLHSRNPKYVPCWDLDNSNWRSINVMTLIGNSINFEAASIPDVCLDEEEDIEFKVVITARKHSMTEDNCEDLATKLYEVLEASLAEIQEDMPYDADIDVAYVEILE